MEAEEVHIREVVGGWWGEAVLVDLVKHEVEILEVNGN